MDWIGFGTGSRFGFGKADRIGMDWIGSDWKTGIIGWLDGSLDFGVVGLGGRRQWMVGRGFFCVVL